MLKIINLIPISTYLTTITIMDKNKDNGNNLGNYTIHQDYCHKKLKKVMRYVKSKYIEKKVRVYRIGNIYMEIDGQHNKICYIKNQKFAKCNDNILIENNEVVNVSNEIMPKLSKYHSIVYKKIREIYYGDDNSIQLHFIEEKCNNETINYIEINFINDSQTIRNNISDLITAIFS